jgi:Rps23 Pro-64 3,4-dihydroxylase Tpa1-like proline 4-hydroxylase
MEDGSIQPCSRSIACIYYLTRDWTAADGGLLIDHEAPGGPQTHVPAFNRYGNSLTAALFDRCMKQRSSA